MEEVLNPGAAEQLGEALSTGSIPAIVGLILLLLAPAILYVTNGKVSSNVGAWISLFRGLAAGVASSLITVAATGSENWWIALIMGCATLIASQGFLDKIRVLIPNNAGPVVLLFFLVIGVSGCSATPEIRAQLATQTVVSQMANASNGLDLELRLRVVEGHEDAMTSIAEECGEPCPDWEQRYDAILEPITQARTVNRQLAASVRLGQRSINVWLEFGELPADWAGDEGRCQAIAEAVAALPGVLEAADVDVPVIITDNAEVFTRRICEAVAEYVEGRSDNE